MENTKQQMARLALTNSGNPEIEKKKKEEKDAILALIPRSNADDRLFLHSLLQDDKFLEDLKTLFGVGSVTGLDSDDHLKKECIKILEGVLAAQARKAELEAEARKAELEAEARKAESEARKAESEARKAESEARKAELEAEARKEREDLKSHIIATVSKDLDPSQHDSLRTLLGTDQFLEDVQTTMAICASDHEQLKEGIKSMIAKHANGQREAGPLADAEATAQEPPYETILREALTDRDIEPDNELGMLQDVHAPAVIEWLDFHQPTTFKTLRGILERLRADKPRPDGWQEVSTDQLDELLSGPMLDWLTGLAKSFSGDRHARYNAIDAELIGRLRDFETTTERHAWLFEPKDEEAAQDSPVRKQIKPKIQMYLRMALMSALEGIFITEISVSNRQLRECNVDARIVNKIVAPLFQQYPLTHVTKERQHEDFKYYGERKKHVQGTSKPETYRVDHTFELRGETREQFVLGVVEVAHDAGPTKCTEDTAKVHRCNKSTIKLLGMQERLIEFQKDLCTAGFFVNDSRIQIYSYRGEETVVMYSELQDFIVPQTRDEWEHQLRTFLCGLLTIAQLACSMRAVALKMLDLPRRHQVERVGTDGDRHFEAKSTPSRSASSKSTGKTPGPTQQSKSGASVSVAGQLKNAMELNASSVRFVFDGRETLDRGDGVTVFFGRARGVGTGKSRAIVAKLVRGKGSSREHDLHQAAAAIASEGVLPVISCVEDGCVIQKVLPSVLPCHARASLLLLPRGQPVREAQLGAIELVLHIANDLCPTLQVLDRHGLVHQDVRVSNTVLFEGRLRLIDFGFAGWRWEACEPRFLECRYHCRQAPELASSSYAGWYGEAQQVFMLGGYVLEALMSAWKGHLPHDAHKLASLDLLAAYEQAACGGRAAPCDAAQLTGCEEAALQKDGDGLKMMQQVAEAVRPMLQARAEDRCNLERAGQRLADLAGRWTTTAAAKAAEGVAAGAAGAAERAETAETASGTSELCCSDTENQAPAMVHGKSEPAAMRGDGLRSALKELN